MISEKKRKSFSSPFKAKVALEVIRDKKILNESSHPFGVHPNLVGQWKREVQKHAAGLFEQKRDPKPLDPVANPEKIAVG